MWIHTTLTMGWFFFIVCAQKWSKCVMPHKDRSVMKMSHCLKGLIWGTTVLVPQLTPTMWVVIISLRCPCRLSHEAITARLNTTWMWPCAPVASPLQTLYRCCRMTDRLIHTCTHTCCVIRILNHISVRLFVGYSPVERWDLGVCCCITSKKCTKIKNLTCYHCSYS